MQIIYFPLLGYDKYADLSLKMQAKEVFKFGNSGSQLKMFAEKQKINCLYLHMGLIFHF